MTLAAARQLAARVHRERELGRDPIADHKARIGSVPNLPTAATTRSQPRRVLMLRTTPSPSSGAGPNACLLGMQPNSLEQIAGGLAERWGEKPVGEIDGHDIWSAVDEARRQGVPGLKARNKGTSEARARALHTALSSLFTWLQRQQRVTSNPCAGLHRPEAPRARERTLSDDEIRLFWQACDAVGEPFGAIFKLLLLTGARLNEVAGMRRSELHANGLWQLPGSRTKNRRPYKVLLPPMASALLGRVSTTLFSRPLGPHRPAVGQGPSGGLMPLCLPPLANLLAMRRLRHGGCTIHRHRSHPDGRTRREARRHRVMRQPRVWLSRRYRGRIQPLGAAARP